MVILFLSLNFKFLSSVFLIISDFAVVVYIYF